MNLTNFRKTPVARVVEFIRREAARYGTAIHHSELVGLIPQDAIEDAAIWYLQLDQFLPEQVLEKRLYAAQQENSVQIGGDVPVPLDREFLRALAAGTPTPGGGSAAAYAASMAAALILMVARLTIGKKKYADVEDEMLVVEENAARLSSELLQAVSEDASAFQSVMEAFRLPKETDQEKSVRTDRIEATTMHAARVPLNVAARAIELLHLTQQLVEKGNLNAISDTGSAAALAGAALTGAALNVRINAPGLRDKESAAGMIAEISDLESKGEELQLQIKTQLYQRGGFSQE
jgi:glutamate formiminotransferase/formiminotetrahydrofolate cyclodeaminase